MWTILPLLKKAETYLDENRVSSSRLEAEILLAHVLSLDRVGLYANYCKPVAPDKVDRFRELVLRRIKGEPSAYLTGKKEFYSLSFQVGPGVLIPRPETEETVEMALGCIEGDGEGTTMLDLGTGSGCIAITLVKWRKNLRACASDISCSAVKAAGVNARRHGVDDRIRFFCGDLFEAISRKNPHIPFQLVVCNPPYVDHAGSQHVDPEVIASEPEAAVFSPPGDSLFYYRRILEKAHPFLSMDGVLIFELGAGLRDEVERLAVSVGWSLHDVRRDLAGIDRAIGFRLSSENQRVAEEH